MTDTLLALETEINEAGHELERTYEHQDVPGTRTGEGWTVKIDGQLVAAGGSVGRVEDALRSWGP